MASNEPARPFFKTDHRAIEWLPVIGVSAWAVYSVLLSHANKERSCWPRLKTIAKKTGLHPSTVSEKIGILKVHGLIHAEECRRDGAQVSNIYTILDCPNAPDMAENDHPPSPETVPPSSEAVPPFVQDGAPPSSQTVPLELDPDLELDPYEQKTPFPSTKVEVGDEVLVNDKGENTRSQHCAGDGDDLARQNGHLLQIGSLQINRSLHSREYLGYPGFCLWWDGYPKKVGKAEALRVWKSLKLEPRHQDLCERLRGWARSVRWQKNGGAYICDPAKWLLQHRDDPPPESPEDVSKKREEEMRAVTRARIERDKAIRGAATATGQQPKEVDDVATVQPEGHGSGCCCRTCSCPHANIEPYPGREYFAGMYWYMCWDCDYVLQCHQPMALNGGGNDGRVN